MTGTVQQTIRINLYRILSDAIERGLRAGYAHAHKHVEHPTEEQLVEHQQSDIMLELCEVIDFDDDDDKKSTNG